MCTTDNTTGDFKGKQFDKKEVGDKVVEQYDEAHARIFYKYVMVGDVLCYFLLVCLFVFSCCVYGLQYKLYFFSLRYSDDLTCP